MKCVRNMIRRLQLVAHRISGVTSQRADTEEVKYFDLCRYKPKLIPANGRLFVPISQHFTV